MSGMIYLWEGYVNIQNSLLHIISKTFCTSYHAIIIILITFLQINQKLDLAQVSRFDSLIHPHGDSKLRKKQNKSVGNCGSFFVCWLLIPWHVANLLRIRPKEFQGSMTLLCITVCIPSLGILGSLAMHCFYLSVWPVMDLGNECHLAGFVRECLNS